MSLLLQREVEILWSQTPYIDEVHGGVAFARAIEAAVTKRLAEGVSVEPVSYLRFWAYQCITPDRGNIYFFSEVLARQFAAILRTYMKRGTSTGTKREAKMAILNTVII